MTANRPWLSFARPFARTKKTGADMIKMFVWTGSLQKGGDRQTLFNEQIAAVCDEAKKLGPKDLGTRYGDEARRAVA
jgi:hypothetical protein